LGKRKKKLESEKLGTSFRGDTKVSGWGLGVHGGVKVEFRQDKSERGRKPLGSHGHNTVVGGVQRGWGERRKKGRETRFGIEPC